MNFLKKLFPSKKSLYDRVTENINPIIVKKFRAYGVLKNSAPTERTSDEKILEIYYKVLQRFQEAASQKGEIIPAKNLNYIVFMFLQFYEKSGEKFMWEHLDFEIMKYHRRGLRPEYLQHEIALF